ncbi:hypothetical protein AVV30_gp093 [Vibrio phage phi 1]|uniref:Uncharacterized protein n=1 Tax=Vibrio phage phi 1 TaxID=1589297 RepID=A0A0B5GYI6_9CAUD|nr:hypothetical protein AVV30_gp093 [Vibrio phage phi 1]AJF40751.1 hypothetical protein SBVP1_0093 [Vibrio phage phi 1]
MQLIKTNVEKYPSPLFKPHNLAPQFQHEYDLWGTNFLVEFEYVPNQE